MMLDAVDGRRQNEEKQAEAVRVRKLTYALIQKEKAALRAKKDKRRAEGLAKAERLHKEEKVSLQESEPLVM